jgi:hypothetical protein
MKFKVVYRHEIVWIQLIIIIQILILIDIFFFCKLKIDDMDNPMDEKLMSWVGYMLEYTIIYKSKWNDMDGFHFHTHYI